MAKQKVCTKCKESKPLSAFDEDKRTKDGISRVCIKCLTGFTKDEIKNKKQCAKCKQLKPISKFTKNKQQKDGLNLICKDCIKKIHEKKKDDYQKMLREFHPEMFNKA